MDSASDPDLYVSGEGLPALGRTYIDSFVWKSVTAGSELVEIHPGHADFRPGLYQIAIHGSCEGVSRYSLLCYLQTVREIRLLDSQVSIQTSLEEWAYFKIRVNHAGASRLLVQTTPNSGPVAVFLSPDRPYPSEKEHLYSMGYYEGRSPVYRPAEDCDPHTLYELDPFDAAYPRDYVEKQKEPRERLESGSLGLRICADTDRWIAYSRVCHIGVLNLGKRPVDLEISGGEIRELDLLEPLERSQSLLVGSLYEQYDLVDISYAERLRKDIAGCHEFTYGEVDFIHFRSLLPYCDLQPGQQFWDLGSGAGKCLLTLALSYPALQRVVGVELLEDLCQLSREVVSRAASPAMAPIHIIQGDLFEVDWTLADCLYCANLCFPQELVERQTDLFERLRAGAKILSLVKLPSRSFLQLAHSFKVKMTWGKAEIFLYIVSPKSCS